MESVIISGPSQCKIRRKYPLPSGYEENFDNFHESFFPGDPMAPAEEPEEESDPYFVWRRNAPFLYDSVAVYNLDWPSLVVEFMDDSASFRVKNGCVSQRLLLGTHTSGSETEFAMVAELRTGVYSLRENMTTCENFNGFLTARKSRENNPALPSAPNLDVKAKIVHPGEINRISHVPKTHFSFITQSNNGTLFLFDYSKHPSNPRDLKTSLPQLVLGGGHSREGYGIAWNSSGKLVSCASDGSLCLWDLKANPATFTKGFSGVSENVPVLVPVSTYLNVDSNRQHSSDNGSNNSNFNSGSTAMGKSDPMTATSVNTKDQQWNKEGKEEANSQGAHTSGLNDVEFLDKDDNVLLTASDDGNVYTMDLRTPPNFASTPGANSLAMYNSSHSSFKGTTTASNSRTSFTNSVAEMGSGVNCLSVNSHNTNYFVCGCEDGAIGLFDLRVPRKKLLLLEHHKESVSQIEFNRACCGLFATSSYDASVCIFDLGCRGQELRFVHQGHKSQVNDISWAKLNHVQAGHVGFTLASVSQDNLLQCFTPNYFSL